MNETTNTAAVGGNEQPAPKKRRSFWVLRLLLLLIAFGGGVVLGLKLYTMPGPSAMLDQYFPTLQTTLNPTAEVKTEKPAVTPAPTQQPATPAPVPTETAKPEPTPAPETQTPAGVIGAADGPTEIVTTAPAEQTPAPIGIDAALHAALDRAKVREEDALVYGVYPTEDSGVSAYAVDFEVKGTEYLYLVERNSGEIVGWNTLRKTEAYADVTPVVAPTEAVTPDSTQEIENLIREEDALKTAQDHAHAKTASGESVVLVREGDDVWYEVSFTAGDFHYSYRVDAVDGTILHFERSK